MEMVAWRDMFGGEHTLLEGRGDDIFYTAHGEFDEEGNPKVALLSKAAILELARKLTYDVAEADE